MVDGTLQEPLLDEPSQHFEHAVLIDSNTRTNNERLVDGMPLWTSLLLKSLYFMEALGSAAWGRFGTIYYNLHGLNSQQIGLIEGLMPSVRTVVQPLWGVLADEFQCRKSIYLFTNIAGTMMVLMLALPCVYSSFYRIILVSLSTMLFASSGILDAYTLDLLGNENKLRYGRYRMWASISWGIGAVIMGYITDHYGFEPNFIIYATLGAMSAALVAWRIPNHVVETPGQDRDSGKLVDLVNLAVRPRVLVFMLENVVIGAGIGTVERLLFLYLVNDLGASTLLCGLTVGVNVLIEVPIFWYAQSIMAAIGHDGMFVISMVCFIVRVLGYTLLTPATRWLVLPLESMHGITFACFWVATTDVAKGLIREVRGWNTTIPTVVQTLYGALGTGIGSIGGGWAMQHYGSRDMYRGMAGIMFLTLLIHILGSIVCRCLFGENFLPNYEGSNEDSEIEEDGSSEEGSTQSSIESKPCCSMSP